MEPFDQNAIAGVGPLGPAVDRTGVEIRQASADRVVGTMPVAGNTQSYGMLHGGVSCVLAETLGTMAAALHAGPRRRAVGVEINATHHRPAVAGTITGTATPLHRGDTLATYRIVLTDDAGRTVCTARLTCLIRDLDSAAGGPGGGEISAR
ncbi:hypothetical protein Athai_55310 [Actinocatenispora thailandica]|uniref:Thioesterase domain-containing protein n=1 Tax=Actinocatenispora thailandica TaxID=227318 RepID=A0A7R7HZA5_9ACTN|nr:PaaI family thioesterase [Actinocatenispora thailandica]BCJ38028.1 hypothetical protein Athai_55310 [Actinocatenispora thailandica]